MAGSVVALTHMLHAIPFCLFSFFFILFIKNNLNVSCHVSI